MNKDEIKELICTINNILKERKSDALKINGYEIYRILVAYPEQYEVFDEIGIIACINYRDGILCIDYPYYGGDVILSEQIGDKLDGMFKSDEERVKCLYKTTKKIKEYDIEKRKEKDYLKIRKKFIKKYEKEEKIYYGIKNLEKMLNDYDKESEKK